MKTQCPHCNQNYDVDANVSGEIVTCQKCGQEFVADPVKDIPPPVNLGKNDSVTTPTKRNIVRYSILALILLQLVIIIIAFLLPHQPTPHSVYKNENETDVEIIGAFGYKLGQELPKQSLKRSDIPYYITRPIYPPFRNFKEVSLSLVPSTNQIHDISTNYLFENKVDCQKEWEFLKDLFIKKYHKVEIKEKKDGTGGVLTVANGKKSIHLVYTDLMINIMYWDQELFDLAQKEEEAIKEKYKKQEIDQIDTSVI